MEIAGPEIAINKLKEEFAEYKKSGPAASKTLYEPESVQGDIDEIESDIEKLRSLVNKQQKDIYKIIKEGKKTDNKTAPESADMEGISNRISLLEAKIGNDEFAEEITKKINELEKKIKKEDKRSGSETAAKGVPDEILERIAAVEYRLKKEQESKHGTDERKIVSHSGEMFPFWARVSMGFSTLLLFFMAR